MTRARAIQPGAAQIRMNLTPMIDMTFLLNVFFLLTSQLSNVEMAEEINLPAPSNSVAVEPAEEHRLIINLIPDEADRTRIAMMRLGFHAHAYDAAGRGALREELLAAVSLAPTLQIDIRADRQAAYREVYPVLRIASASGARHVELVVAASLPSPGDQAGSEP